MALATVTILRHGQSQHNVDRGYKYRDPLLTDLGRQQASAVPVVSAPDLIVISPMTRTIQTALIAFKDLGSNPSSRTSVQIWPDLREAHDAICNKGVSRAELSAKFPQFDFSECREQWDYEEHSHEVAVVRAERVRRLLQDMSQRYRNIYVVTHRGFIAYLVKGTRFDTGELRRYQFAPSTPSNDERLGLNVDSGLEQDFGPTMLVPVVIPSGENEES